MKHGLTGAGVVLIDMVRQEVATEYHALAEIVKPQNLLEQRLVEQAAIGSVRFLRAQAQSEAMTRDRVDSAVAAWDAGRDAEVAGAIARLGSDPAGALDRLATTTEGCDALADEWAALGAALDGSGRWDAVRTERALRLLGEAGVPTTASEPRRAELYLAALATRGEPDPRLLARFFADPQASPDLLPTADEARSALRALVEAESAHWQARADEHWDGRDRPARDSAIDRALNDVTPEGDRLHRYQKDGANLMDRSLKALTAHRKEQARIEKAGGLPPPGFAPKLKPMAARPRNEAIWAPGMPKDQKPKLIDNAEVAAEPTVASASMPSAPERPESPPIGGPAPADRPASGDRPPADSQDMPIS